MRNHCVCTGALGTRRATPGRSLAIRGLASLVVGISITASWAAAQTAPLPQFGHVFFVAFENNSYSSVVGSSSMPYLNSLIPKYGLATNYVADTHPSIGNYMVLTTGQILTNNDSETPSSFPVSADNIAHEAELAGKTWKDYAEHTGNYIVRHDPLAYMTNINTANLVDFTQFATDLASGNLPDLSWIVPNGCDSAHDCSLSTADTWLQTNLGPLIASPLFQKDGLLIITFDEGSGSGSCTTAQIESGTWCGGQVATLVISPLVASAGIQSANSYHHENVLRLMSEALGLTTFPGASAAAADMSDFFAPASPTVSLTPASVSFGNVAVGTTSTGQTLTLKNGTSSAVSISSIALGGANSGDYAQTNTCGTSLAAAASCTIDVTFTPTATGPRAATLTVTDNGPGSPQVAALTGTGASASASLSPTSLTFSSEPVGTTSAAQTLTLTNSSSSTLTITNMAVSGDFAFANTSTCGSTLAAGAPCTIDVTFTPTATGTRTGTVTVTDGASNSPQTATLTGTGTTAMVSLSPSSLSFGPQMDGMGSSPKTITMTNNGTSLLTISSITASGNFSETNTCGSSLAAGANCTISVTFNPKAGGTLTGSISVSDNAPGSPQTAALNGTSEDFAMQMAMGSSNSATVSPGQTATYMMSLMGEGGMNQTVTFTCAGAPAKSTCTVSPSTMTPSSTAQNVTVSVSTTAASSAPPLSSPLPPASPRMPWSTWWMMLVGLLAAGMVWTLGRSPQSNKRRRRAIVAALATCLLLSLWMMGCGGGGSAAMGNSGTPAGTYTLTVTGTSGAGSSALTHQTTLNLTVQ